MKLRDLVLGVPFSRPISQKKREGEKAYWWRHPFDPPIPVPNDHFPELLMLAKVLLAVRPGWKLHLYLHLNPARNKMPHLHSGRVCSFILAGGYVEERVDARTGKHELVHHKPWSINWIPLHVLHRVHDLPKRYALTLVVVFPNVQEMGFWYDNELKSEGWFQKVGRPLAFEES